MYQSVLPRNVSRIAPCNPYRDRRVGETDGEYVLRLKNGLRQRILELGPKNVAGFIVEPVVGAVSFYLFSHDTPISELGKCSSLQNTILAEASGKVLGRSFVAQQRMATSALD
jgi:adenosylmethionine-8-amino-7-oxononanoate aminotransferase